MSEDNLSDDSLIDALDQALLAQQGGKKWPAGGAPAECPGGNLERLLEAQKLLVEAAGWIRGASASPEVEAVTTTYQPATPLAFGRYRVEELVGVGGMGVVYRAHDPELGRTVAIKVPRMKSNGRERADFTARFLREARSAAAVRHTNICPIYDVGEQDGAPFVVMAYVKGGTLAQRLRAEGRYESPAEAVKLVQQLAGGLAAIHAEGLVHRDIKPANILLDPQGTPLLTDFGLARAAGEAGLTREGVIAGTPIYMSPEQARGGTDVRPASDLYNLGIVLYQMLTGVVPYAGESVPVILNKIVHEPLTPITDHRPDLDPSLVSLIERATEKAPQRRFPDSRAFARALGDWLATAERSPRPKRLPLAQVGLFLLLAALLGAAGWAVAHLPGNASPGEESPIPLASAPLDGELQVSIYSPRGEDLVKPGLLVDQEGALPVRNGELVHLEVVLNRPAFVYLVWIDSQGASVPLYPWDSERSNLGWKAPLLAAGRTPVARLHCPSAVNRGFALIGPDGLETTLLLARESPLEDPRELEKWIGRLPPARASSPREVAWLGLGPMDLMARHDRPPLHRGVETGATQEIDRPIFTLLDHRLRSRFELLKAVRFAHESR